MRILRFIARSFKGMVSPPVAFHLLIKQMEFVGNRSVGIILLAGATLGAVFGMQMGEFLLLFNSENMIGATTAFGMARELAPVFCSFLVAARAGSAMASEIGTMRVNEQIDALKIMAINPIYYLASPRILAATLMMPLLTGIFLLSGIAACFVVGVIIFDVDVGLFFDSIPRLVGLPDVQRGLEKAFAFGMIFSVISCYRGYYTAGGAKGVGKSTSQAVVLSLVVILLMDLVLSFIQFKVAPPTMMG